MKKNYVFTDCSFSLNIVTLVINGFAQNPMLKIYPSVKYKKIIPKRKPNISPSTPTINGTIAPPIIAVQRIPENEP